MTVVIPDDIARRLAEHAARRDSDIEELLREMIERYDDERPADEKPWATLADLARHAKKMNMASSKPVNTAERSRKILNTEYADHLKSRIDP